MGLFSKLIRDTVGKELVEGISGTIAKGAERLSEAAGAMEKKPEAETTAHAATAACDAEQTAEPSVCCDANENCEKVLQSFPRWTFSPIQDCSDNDEDEFISVMITAAMTDDQIAAYQKLLRENGFDGDWQIMKKERNGKKYFVDFSFVPDSQLQYLIYK